MLHFGLFLDMKKAAPSFTTHCNTSQTFNLSLTREPNDTAKNLKNSQLGNKIADFSYTGGRNGQRDLDIGE